ncbi:MAG: inositol monophosphatase family protein [Acidimicrobiales bacterium]
MALRTAGEDVVLAHELATVAAEVALGFFDGPTEYETKGDGSPVSEADLAVEAALVELIRSRRPGDGIVSEEAGEVAASASRRWLLDPIDGTVYFIQGSTGWGTHVALEVDGEIVIGVITRPVRRVRWWAARGVGAFRSPDHDPTGRATPIAVSHTSRLDQATVGVFAFPSSDLPDRLSAAGARVRRLGSHIPDLGEGSIDAVVADRGCGLWWGHAPAVVLIEEAGGVFVDPDGGRRPDRQGGIYTNAHLLPQVIAAIGWTFDPIQRL